MLTGRVTSDNEAILPIALLGAEGRIVRVEAVIDTGYNGFLTLPKTAIEELDLSFVGPTRAQAIGARRTQKQRRCVLMPCRC